MSKTLDLIDKLLAYLDSLENSCEKCCDNVKSGICYATPLDAFKNGKRELLLFVTATRTNQDEKAPDFVAVVDVDPLSPTYCQIINEQNLDIGAEVHHSGWNACASCFGDKNISRNILIVPAFTSGNVYFIDVSDPYKLSLKKKIDGKEIEKKYGLSYPHTSHCLANGDIMISYLGSINDKPDFLLFNGQSFEPKGTWISKNSAHPKYNYDFWYQPYFNIMISTEWGTPKAFSRGFNLEDVSNGLYGTGINLWNWKTHELIKTFHFDITKLCMALEIRFAHNPKSPHCWFNGCLSSNIVHVYLDENSQEWKVNEKYIQVDGHDMENWGLPTMPGLITDIILSMDDHYLYFSNWLHGDIRQYDISNPFNPKLVSTVYVGGLIHQQSDYKVKNKQFKAPSIPKIKGTEIVGGPQMLQLSLDGKRLYVTNSLFSPFDQQFYPSLMKKGGQIILIDIDHDKNEMKINENFFVDFGKCKNGPARPHEMRYLNGDCTSDIFIVQDK